MARIDIPKIIRQTRQEYSDSYESMNWLTPEKAGTVSRLREDLINAIFDNHGGQGTSISLKVGVEVNMVFLMPRQARIDAPGALHHIVVRGIGTYRDQACL